MEAHDLTEGWITTSAARMLLAGYQPEYVADFIVRFESRLPEVTT